MNRSQKLKSKYFVKLFQHPVQIIYNIISCCKHMTGIQTDSDPLRMGYPIADCFQLFKSPANLCPFSAHCLKQNRNILFPGNRLVKPRNDILNPCFCANSGMASRMKHQILDPQSVHPRHILPDHRTGKFIHLRLRTRQIHRIRCMRQNRSKTGLSSDPLKLLRFLHCRILIIRSPRIPAENLHRIRMHLHHVLCSLHNPFRDRHMCSYYHIY